MKSAQFSTKLDKSFYYLQSTIPQQSIRAIESFQNILGWAVTKWISEWTSVYDIVSRREQHFFLKTTTKCIIVSPILRAEISQRLLFIVADCWLKDDHIK